MKDTQLRPFHLAIPVTDIETTRKFYVDVLQCSVGRESDRWIDFNFFGHQLTSHLVLNTEDSVASNNVDEEAVPVRHFGIILEWKDWQDLADKLKVTQVEFIIEPTIRFKGKTGEQATMFIKDPSGNVLEFKSFRDDEKIFKT